MEDSPTKKQQKSLLWESLLDVFCQVTLAVLCQLINPLIMSEWTVLLPLKLHIKTFGDINST